MKSPIPRASAAIVAIAALGFLSVGCGDSDGESSGQSTAAESQQSHYEGGEEGVEGFGSEAKGLERSAILVAESSYLHAIGAEGYEAACSRLSAGARRSLSQLVGRELGLAGCAATLPKLLSPNAPAIARSQVSGEVTKVRVEGNQAFVVFRAAGAKLYVFTMVHEGDEWKATSLGASVLVPSAATLEAE